MASITSLSNTSSASSIYGTRNILSGLASGMDTETMIENAVAGIKMKISSLQQKRTKVEWQQEAYRSIIDKAVNFTQKYTSYASSTNLLSSSFFSSAVKTTTNGTNADMVSATGKTSSDVKILGVKQLATAATYSVSGLAGISSKTAVEGEQIDLNEILPQSKVSGTMTLSYGGSRTIDLEFGELETYSSVEDLAKGIREKLDGIQVSNSSGELKKASEMVNVEVKNGNIVFSDGQNAGNKVSISSATGKIKETLSIDPSKKSDTLTVGSKGTQLIDNSATKGEYLSGKTLSVTLDGVTKKITMPEYTEDMTGKEYLEGLQASLDKAFGSGKIVVDTSKGSADDGTFTLEMNAGQTGSTLSVTSTVAEAMGLPKSGDANYINTGKKLGELLGDDFDWSKVPMIEAVGAVREVKTDDETYYVDSKGNRVAKSYDGQDGVYYRVDSDGNYLRDFSINGVSIGQFSKDTALESVMTAINSNADAGVKVSYSKMTNEFLFTATETGTAGEIEFGDGLAKELFGTGGDFTQGQDAILSMSVNGTELKDVTRSSNTFDVDGMTVTLRGEFNYTTEDETDEDGNVTKAAGTLMADAEKSAVTFTSSSDADKIVDAIKSMVEDYNEMITEIKNAYSTQPATKSDGSRYDPLTEDDMAGMSESAIAKYEETAKQGILFGDSNLSSMYSKLLSAITPGGTDGQTLRDIGINTTYSNGLTTLSLDETALRNALESDPDKVKNAFTKTAESGSSSNGLMQNMVNTMNTYVKTTGEPKGVLIAHAGSLKAPTSLNSNSLLTQMNSIDSQIERWQDKMSSQIDRYTTQFTRLEQLIAEMNSQSSALMGLMGGSSSY